MKIKNPVIPGFHPDPSLLRVGEDYYIATSTFEWFPGVRIHHSKDLVNWELAAYALKDDTAVDMTGLDMSCGIWAPNLTYDNGTFYLAYTIVYTDRPTFKDTHNFVITAENIKGPWSKPVPLSRSGFDPSIFHDTDGKKYLVNMTMDYREKKYRFSGIDVQEYDAVNKKLTGEPVRIFRGTSRGTTEGPNIMKRNGWYYLVCAEGGTGIRHCVTVVRSKSIHGPYEECPYNPIMTAMDKPECELQRAGHAQVIEGVDGNWYMAHLCSRPLSGYSILGRETGIQNVHWTEDGWFRLTANDGGNPELYFEVPDSEKTVNGITYGAISHSGNFLPNRSEKTTFESGEIPLSYMTLRRSFKTNGIEVKDGVLRIQGGCSLASKYQQGLLARPQQSFNCDFTTAIRFNPKNLNHIAGLLVYYNCDNCYHLRITKDKRGKLINLTSVSNKNINDSDPVYLQEDTDIYYLKAEIRREEVKFYYSINGEDYQGVGQIQDMKNISDEHIEGNGFTGSMVGVNCSDLQGDGVYADFLWLNYNEIDME
jgi:xylan 1,4-beta-xylosidase